MSIVGVRWPRVLTSTQLSQILRNQKNPLTALKIFNEVKVKYPNYRHNGPVYATLIGMLGNSGKIMEMKGLIDQMKEDSCECKDSVFAAAIRTYGGTGLLGEAISLFKSLPEFNCVNWTESFNTILEILVKESKLETAHRVFVENSYGWEVKSRLPALNMLMEALCKSKRSDLALHIFQEMDLQGCYPDRKSYRVLMKGLCEDGRLNEAIHLLYSMFWRISQKGCGEDIVVYRTLLDALCDIGQVEEAVETLGKILRKGLKAPKRCRHRVDLSHCKFGKDIEAAKRLINEALVRGAIPSLTSFSAMAIDLYSDGKIGDGDSVIDEMQDKGFRPTPSIYKAKLAALCRAGKVEEAVKVIEEEMVEANCVPTVSLYNIIINGLCDAGKSELAVGYLRKMSKQVGCVADKDTYDILVNGLCRDGKFIVASRVLEEMSIKSYWPSNKTYSTVIRGLCSIGKPYEAVMWLEEMVSQSKLPDSSVWISLVASVCRNKTEIDL